MRYALICILLTICGCHGPVAGPSTGPPLDTHRDASSVQTAVAGKGPTTQEAPATQETAATQLTVSVTNSTTQPVRRVVFSYPRSGVWWLPAGYVSGAVTDLRPGETRKVPVDSYPQGLGHLYVTFSVDAADEFGTSVNMNCSFGTPKDPGIRIKEHDVDCDIFKD